MSQCNCFHTMGSGVARFIREAYPEAYAADLRTKYGSSNKLGSFSVASTESTPKKFIYNVYSQFRYGTDKRYTVYDAVADGLEGVRNHAIDHSVKILGIPYKYGSGLAGGDWRIVNAIIESVFLDEDRIQLFICQYEPKS